MDASVVDKVASCASLLASVALLLLASVAETVASSQRHQTSSRHQVRHHPGHAGASASRAKIGKALSEIFFDAFHKLHG